MSVKGTVGFIEKHSSLLNGAWRVLFYPFIAGVFYLCAPYLNIKYASKEEFTAYKTSGTIVLDKISGKLDTLLLRDSASNQIQIDVQRRLSRVEERLDSYTAIKK